MARWGVTGNKGVANVQGVLTLHAAAAGMRRAKIADWTIGCASNPPFDQQILHIAQRCTTLATGAAKVPNSTDPADTLASTIVCFDTVTADPTLTAGAILLEKALNERASFRWAAQPGFELIIPAVANNGVLLGLSAVSTRLYSYDAMFEEA
jgi:hypothetical protein